MRAFRYVIKNKLPPCLANVIGLLVAVNSRMAIAYFRRSSASENQHDFVRGGHQIRRNYFVLKMETISVNTQNLSPRTMLSHRFGNFPMESNINCIGGSLNFSNDTGGTRPLTGCDSVSTINRTKNIRIFNKNTSIECIGLYHSVSRVFFRFNWFFVSKRWKCHSSVIE